LKVNGNGINQQSKLAWLFLPINKMQVQSQDAPVVTRTACIQYFIRMSTICLQWQCFMWIPQLQLLVCTACQAVGAINWKMQMMLYNHFIDYKMEESITQTELHLRV
jgi:hypothetical protein